MVYYKMGDVIRELRDRLHMTQEELAAGICSVSSIAKIEKGSQNPSGRVAEALLRRLKDVGCFFTGFSQSGELLELSDWNRVVAQAKGGGKRNSLFEEQFYDYVLFENGKKKASDHSLQLLELMKLLVMSMPLDELYDETATRKTYTYLELYLLNSIAVEFFYMKSLEASNRILERLAAYLNEWHAGGEVERYLYPVVCNNLAAVKLSIGLSHPALLACDQGIASCLKNGILLPLPTLYGNQSNAFYALGETAEAQQADSRMRALRSMLSDRPDEPGPVELELLKGNCLMSFMW